MEINKKFIIVWIVILIIIIGIFLYFIWGYNTAEKNTINAKVVAENFYSDLEKGDLNSASQFYHKNFTKKISLKEINNILNNADSRLGKIENLSLIDAESRFDSDSIVTLTYKIKRQNYDTYDTLVLYKDDSDTDFKILSFATNSSELAFD